MIRLALQKPIYGLVTFGTDDGAVTKLSIQRETPLGQFLPVGTFDIDPTQQQMQHCFETPIQSDSFLLEILEYEKPLTLNFNLLIKN